MDTGCSTTVCGIEWLDEYVSKLAHFQRSCITEEHSDASFTFGDGNFFKSLKRVNMPCYIGGENANITTDVIQCNIPMLMSE